MQNIIFLASGNGGNLKFIYKALSLMGIKGVNISVIADRKCGTGAFAAENLIPVDVIKYDRSDNKELVDNLTRIDPDMIITNWHKIIDQNTISMFCGKLINLHYSLLPAFGGLIGTAPIIKAYEAGCKYVGATCHYVDEGVDTGKIIAQTIVRTDIALSGVIDRVFRNGCLILLDTTMKHLSLTSANCTARSSNDFSPRLGFDDSIFDERFWGDISKS